jgi:exodeoxyribonuclease VIII
MHQQVGVFDYSNEQYHSSEGISRSQLWVFKQLPRKYWYQYLSGQYQRTSTQAFTLGSLAHTLILEPHLFHEEYCLKPELEEMPPALLLKDVGREAFDQSKIDREEVKNRNDALKKAFEQNIESKTVITKDELELAQNMKDSIYANKAARNLIENAKIEKSIYFRDEKTSLLLKTRPDVWNGSIVCDLKTTNDASLSAFQNSAFKDGYFLQAAMMFEGLKSINEAFDKFVFICVEKKPPFSTALYVIDNDALQYGLNLMRKTLDDFKECLDKNEWPDYGAQILTVPAYAKREQENEY